MSCQPSSELRHLNRLNAEMDATYHLLARKLGLSDSVTRIFYILYQSNAPCPLRVVCQAAALPKQTIHSALRKMEADNLIRMVSTGGRSRAVCLTPQGQIVAERTAGQMIHFENEVLASFFEEERLQYLALTERFLNELQKKTKQLEKEI